MFAARINFASIRASRVAVGRSPSVNNRQGFSKQPSLDSVRRLTPKIDNADAATSSLDARNFSLQIRCGWIRAYSTNAPDVTDAPSSADVFGDLGSRKFERVEMDEDEKAEEKFVDNEARVLRRHRLTPGGYAKLIKSHIQKRDLKAALQVLETVKENRDKPTVYMYNLLLRAFAVSGDFKKCRSLYTTMKKRGLECNAATYTSILNACANYGHTPTALEYLSVLREEFLEKNVRLNETHYNAMIKAYGRHNQLLEAFKIADEMRDKRLPTDEVTFNSLLNGAISDREAGLRHALGVWHIMRIHKIKPTLTTYNLMLRAIRDTKLGELKAHDNIVGTLPEHRIHVSEKERPDLLSKPPVVSPLAVKRIGEETEATEDDETEVAAGEAGAIGERKPEVVAKELDAIGEGGSKVAAESSDLPATVATDSEATSLTSDEKQLIRIPLEKIHRKNKLILFGGLTGILERMANDGVTPDTRTITLLMELVPKTAAAEKNIISLARSKGIPLDIDFFNMLMKKRTLRKDYAGAKDVLDDIQRCGLCPDVITWGIMAMGCENSQDARDLIEGMNMTGHRLNAVIAGTLITTACRRIRFGFVLEIMETMKRMGVKPNWELYSTLDNFQMEMEQMIKSGKFSRTVNHPAFKNGFSKFNLRYVSWQEEMGRKIEKKGKKT